MIKLDGQAIAQNLGDSNRELVSIVRKERRESRLVGCTCRLAVAEKVVFLVHALERGLAPVRDGALRRLRISKCVYANQ